MSGPFKMKGYTYPGKSPVKDTEDKKHIHHGGDKEWAHKHYSKVGHGNSASDHKVDMDAGGKETATHFWKQDPKKPGVKVAGTGKVGMGES